MAKLDDVYESDADAAENGAWVTLRPGAKDSKPMRVKIRSAHSRKVRKEEIKVDKRLRVQYLAGNGVLDPEASDERDVRLIVGAILVDWQNFEGDDGKPLVFKHDVVVETLEKYPQLRRELLVLSRMDDNFRPDRTESERDGLAKN